MCRGARSAAVGAPPGGPLSPLLSSLVLDELDRQLEGRGPRFVRYADDCNIYVRSERAGRRAMASITRFVDRKLKLGANRDRSGVDTPWRRIPPEAVKRSGVGCASSRGGAGARASSR